MRTGSSIFSAFCLETPLMSPRKYLLSLHILRLRKVNKAPRNPPTTPRITAGRNARMFTGTPSCTCTTIDIDTGCCGCLCASQAFNSSIIFIRVSKCKNSVIISYNHINRLVYEKCRADTVTQDKLQSDFLRTIYCVNIYICDIQTIWSFCRVSNMSSKKSLVSSAISVIFTWFKCAMVFRVWADF